VLVELLEVDISSLTFPQLVFKESNLLSMMETIGSVTIETNQSDMKYQPPKALQAQSRNRAIKNVIQNKFEFDSKIFNSFKTFTLSVDNVYYTSLPQYYVIVY
jgi:hypothetical protein